MVAQSRPLDIAKILGVPQAEVAFRLRITPDWLRQLGRRKDHRRRVLVAVLEAGWSKSGWRSSMTAGSRCWSKCRDDPARRAGHGVVRAGDAATGGQLEAAVGPDHGRG